MGFFSKVGGILNDFTGITSQQNQTYKQQVQAMNAQNAYNTAMWNAQNEYNSPVAQLARMREAGIDINPTSYALGTGNLSNTATFVGSENGFSGSGSPAGNPITMALGVANGISEIRNRNALTDNLGVQNENLHAQNANLLVQNASTRIDNDIKRHNLEVARELNMPVGEVPSAFGVRLNPKELGSQLVDAIPGFGSFRRAWNYFSKK